MMFLSLLALSPMAAAQDNDVTCFLDEGPTTELSVEGCLERGGASATCDARTCTVVDTRGNRESVETSLSAEMGLWGQWFETNTRTDTNAVPFDPFDPQLLDPCTAWALQYDQDPSICEASGSPGSTPTPPQCPPHDEIACGVCSVAYVACVAYAASMGPFLGGVYYGLVCHPEWKDCIGEECGLDC